MVLSGAIKSSCQIPLSTSGSIVNQCDNQIIFKLRLLSLTWITKQTSARGKSALGKGVGGHCIKYYIDYLRIIDYKKLNSTFTESCLGRQFNIYKNFLTSHLPLKILSIVTNIVNSLVPIKGPLTFRGTTEFSMGALLGNLIHIKCF